MGFIDYVGRSTTMNDIEFDPGKGIFVKRFRRIPHPLMLFPVLYGPLERKPHFLSELVSRDARYKREKYRAIRFHEKGVNTPKLIEADDNNYTLTFELMQLIDLSTVFENASIPLEEKVELCRGGLEQLYLIHEIGESHGDPYPKNFYVPGRTPLISSDSQDVYTSDFEIQRVSQYPWVVDLIIFVGGSAKLLNDFHPDRASSTLEELERILKDVYAERPIPPFPSDLRDRLFCEIRFRRGKELLRMFGPEES